MCAGFDHQGWGHLHGQQSKAEASFTLTLLCPHQQPNRRPGIQLDGKCLFRRQRKTEGRTRKAWHAGNGKPALKTNNVTFMRRSVYSLCFRRLGIKYLDRNHISSLKLLKHNSIDTYKAKNLWLRKILKHTPSKKKGGGVNWRLPIRPQTNHNFFFTFQSWFIYSFCLMTTTVTNQVLQEKISQLHPPHGTGQLTGQSVLLLF